MENKIYYIKKEQTASEPKEIYSEEEIKSNFFFVKVEKDKLYLFKDLSESFEEITKMVIGSGTELEETIEGPALKKIKDINTLEKLLFDKQNLRIWTDKTGMCYIANSAQIIYITGKHFVGQYIPTKLIIEPSKESLKVKKLYKFVDFRNNKISSQNAFEMVSFGFKDNLARIYSLQRVNESIHGKFLDTSSFFTFLRDLPKDIIQHIANILKEEREEFDGKVHETPEASEFGLVAFNMNPGFKEYLKLKNFYTSLLDHDIKEKNEVYKKIAEILKFDYDENFVKYMDTNPFALAFTSIAKDSGLKNVDKVFNILNNCKNLNETAKNLDFSCYLHKWKSNTLTDFGEALKIALKYRTEEEVTTALEQMASFNPAVWRAIITLENYGLFDGNLFDRFVYNKFNEHAAGLVVSIAREEFNKVVENGIDKSTYKLLPSSIETYEIKDKDSKKRLIEMAKVDNYSFGDVDSEDCRIAVCIHKKNYVFVVVNKNSSYYMEYYPNCNLAWYKHNQINDMNKFFSEFYDECKKDFDIGKEDEDLPFF